MHPAMQIQIDRLHRFRGATYRRLHHSAGRSGERNHRAVETIDLNLHRGVHPRLGAVDVIPFVPIRGITMAECAAMAVRAGGEIWRRLALPVYLYGEGRRKLEDVRRGQFEGLRNSVLVDES